MEHTVSIKGQYHSFTSAFSSDEGAAEALRGTDNNFGASLLEKLDAYGRLSEAQWAWVHKLATEKAQPTAAAKKLDVDLSDIVAMMDLAAEAQKRAPKIVLERDGSKVVLARAGERAKMPGSINVTDGRPFGENIWYGRIQLDGSMQESRSMTDDVRELLTELSADPAKVAGQNGIATGCCCFCAKLLSTRESRSVGYGPVCADKFGLPWGDTSVADAADAAAKGDDHGETCRDCGDDGFLSLIGDRCEDCNDRHLDGPDAYQEDFGL